MTYSVWWDICSDKQWLEVVFFSTFFPALSPSWNLVYIYVGPLLFKLLLFGEQVWGSSFPTAKLWRDQILERKAKYVCVSTYVDFSSVSSSSSNAFSTQKGLISDRSPLTHVKRGKFPAMPKLKRLGILGGPKLIHRFLFCQILKNYSEFSWLKFFALCCDFSDLNGI